MGTYFPIIVATIIGFFILAALLLVPVYRFLKREEEASKHWTPEMLARRVREEKVPNGRPPESVRNRKVK